MGPRNRNLETIETNLNLQIVIHLRQFLVGRCILFYGDVWRVFYGIQVLHNQDRGLLLLHALSTFRSLPISYVWGPPASFLSRDYALSGGEVSLHGDALLLTLLCKLHLPASTALLALSVPTTELLSFFTFPYDGFPYQRINLPHQLAAQSFGKSYHLICIIRNHQSHKVPSFKPSSIQLASSILLSAFYDDLSIYASFPFTFCEHLFPVWVSWPQPSIQPLSTYGEYRLRELSTHLRFFNVHLGSCEVLPLTGPKALRDAFSCRHALAAQLGRATLFRTHVATYHADAWSHVIPESSI